jgi:hypothetical protein
VHSRWKIIQRRIFLEELYDEEPEESGDYHHPDIINDEEIEEVIDTLTDCLAALSQNNRDAYLESFESDDDESSLADLVDSDDYGSEKEDEVGAVVVRCSAVGSLS